MSNHERYTISINFIVCDGLKDSVLGEMRQILEYVPKTLGHAYDVKIKVTHTPENSDLKS